MSTTHRALAKSAGTISGFTAASRVLGFVRDLVIATTLGTGVGAEAFVVSFKIPNALRDLVGEGAANSAIVPVLTECHEKKKEEFWALVSTLFLISAAVLAVLSTLGVLFAPQIAAVLAPGFIRSADPSKFPLTAHLTRVIFPYIFLIGLSALAMGVLNSLREFTSSALGPVLMNISMIACGYFFERIWGPMALVVGVLAGGALQLACQVPPLLANGFHFVRPRVLHDYARKIGRLLIPRAMGSAIYQVNVFVDSILASFESIVGPGGQSALYYSNRLFQLPLAVFGIALAQAILPTFSTQVLREDREGFRQTFSLAVRSLMLIVLPAAVGLAVLCRPIVRIIFQHGRFNAASTAITSSALFFYAFGLLSCCLVKILVNAFYSMQDTRTPVKTMAVSVAVNVLLCLVFMRPLKIGGLTLASTLSATLNMALLYHFLKKKMGDLEEKRIAVSFAKILAAAVLMGAAAGAYDRFVLEPRAAAATSAQACCLAAGIGLSVLVYLALAFLMKIEEIRKFIPPPLGGRIIR